MSVPGSTGTSVPTSQRPLNGATSTGFALAGAWLAKRWGLGDEYAVPIALAVGGLCATLGDYCRGVLESNTLPAWALFPFMLGARIG